MVSPMRPSQDRRTDADRGGRHTYLTLWELSPSDLKRESRHSECGLRCRGPTQAHVHGPWGPAAQDPLSSLTDRPWPSPRAAPEHLGAPSPPPSCPSLRPELFL